MSRAKYEQQLFINKKNKNPTTSVYVFIWITEALSTYCWTKSRGKKKRKVKNKVKSQWSIFLNMVDSQKYIFFVAMIMFYYFFTNFTNKREYNLDPFKMHNFDWSIQIFISTYLWQPNMGKFIWAAALL